MPSKKMTQEEYIRRAKEMHGIAYIYTKTVYTHSHNKVTVTCPKHGDWEVAAAQHIRKNGASGCHACTGRTATPPNKRGAGPLTTEAWITKAKAAHGDLYDYSLVNYTHSLKPVTVICKLHGPFTTIANNHVNIKTGCSVCAGQLRREVRLFVIRARTIHGTKYDYKLVQPFLTAEDHVTIVCPVHGNFEQKIKVHLKGSGCQNCGWETTGNKNRGTKKRKMTVVTI